MEDLLKVLVGVLSSIIVAGGGLVIAWLHNKTKKLEAEKRVKDQRIYSLQNGFRDHVYERLGKLEENDETMKQDIKLIKNTLCKEGK